MMYFSNADFIPGRHPHIQAPVQYQHNHAKSQRGDKNYQFIFQTIQCPGFKNRVVLLLSFKNQIAKELYAGEHWICRRRTDGREHGTPPQGMWLAHRRRF
jgi:hypothetical protein